MTKKDLEKVMQEKIEPLIEESTQKFLGVSINELNKDISEKIKKNPFFSFDIDINIPFKKAKKLFKKQFLTKMLRQNYGNIAKVAQLIKIDRRSIHRAVHELNIDVKKQRHDMLKPSYIKNTAVTNLIKDVLKDYEQIIHPSKMKQIYEQVPSLSKDITKDLPEENLTLKQAEEEFEKRYLLKALQKYHFNISQTARAINIRYETLHRKIKKLNI